MSASAGQRATRVGTVDTTVTSLATSQGPSSMPLRTSERGAGTRHAPYRQASHISSHDASKATDRPAITRSPGPSGCSCRNRRDSASTNAAALRCDTATPFGAPVEPDVKITHASSLEAGTVPSATGVLVRRTVSSRSSFSTAATSASANTVRARSSGSSASTGTYAAPARSVPAIPTYRSVVPERIRTPTLSPGPTPAACSSAATSSAASRNSS